MEKFEASGKDFGKAAYRYNEELDRWEAYEIDVSALTEVCNSADGWDV